MYFINRQTKECGTKFPKSFPIFWLHFDNKRAKFAIYCAAMTMWEWRCIFCVLLNTIRKFTISVWKGKTGFIEANIIQDKKPILICLDGKVIKVIGMQCKLNFITSSILQVVEHFFSLSFLSLLFNFTINANGLEYEDIFLSSQIIWIYR
jgi:hypothetical protein